MPESNERPNTRLDFEALRAAGGDGWDRIDDPEAFLGRDEQPAPTPNDRPAVWHMVIADMQARDTIGRERYGTPLQPFNGRDALRDLYEELLDAVVYTRQELIERAERDAVYEAMRAALKPFAEAYMKSSDAQNRMEGIGDTDPKVFRQWLDENTVTPSGTNVGHYRQAAAALARAAELERSGS